MKETKGRERTRVVDRKVVFYLAWLAVAVGLSLLVGRLSPANVTALCAVGFFALALALRPLLARAVRARPPAVVFVVGCLLGACFLEAFHMISKPFSDALLVTRATPLPRALASLAIDLAFTVPSYLVIFTVMWWLTKRYRFSPFEYLMVMSLGQCLGDGGLFFFLAAPPMLLLLPYAIVKYQAMSYVPYLLVRDRIQPKRGSWTRLVAPIVVIFVTYFACASVMNPLFARSPWATASAPV